MFAALLDVKFDQLITRRLLSVIYVVLAGVVLLGGLFTGLVLAFRGVGPAFVAVLLVLPLTFVQLLLIRVGVEAVVVYFRIGEDVRALRDAGIRTSGPGL